MSSLRLFLGRNLLGPARAHPVLAALAFFGMIGLAFWTAPMVSARLGDALVTKAFQSGKYKTVKTSYGTVEQKLKLEHVPENHSERVDAPLSGLLPSEWVEDPVLDRMRFADEADDPVPLVSEEHQVLHEAVWRFLRVWETFAPTEGLASYEKRLRPLTTDFAIKAVAERRDSLQSPAICPEPICTRGSTFVEPLVGATIVRDYDKSTAYVTTLAWVNIGSDEHPDYYLREYAFLLERFDGTWLVGRAAAKTLPNQ